MLRFNMSSWSSNDFRFDLAKANSDGYQPAFLQDYYSGADSTGMMTLPDNGLGNAVSGFKYGGNALTDGIGGGVGDKVKGFGDKIGGYGVAAQGLAALGSLWSASKQQKQAKKQFKFAKEVANANLSNSIKSYNNSLSDRLSSRGAYQQEDKSVVDDQIKRQSLSR